MHSSGRSPATPPEMARRLEALIAAGRAGAPSMDEQRGAGRSGAGQSGAGQSGAEHSGAEPSGGWTPPEVPERGPDGGGPVRLARTVWAALAAARERRPVRVRAGRRGVAGIAVAVIVVAALVGWRVLADRPRLDPLGSAVSLSSPAPSASGRVGSADPSSSGSSSGPGTSAVRPSPASVVVDVVGRVRRPGVVRLPTGSRVEDALRAAGGVLPGTDLTGLNQARVLVDGEQIAVAVPGATGAAPVPGPGSVTASTAGGPLDLNTATVAQLDALPGVGPVLAQRIVDWRTEHGRFDSVDQLNDVSGIGEAKFADLKPLVSV